MQQPETAFQHGQQHAAGCLCSLRIVLFIPEDGLAEFQVPVAILIPDELMQ